MNERFHVAIDIGAGSGRMFVGWLMDGRLHLKELHRFETGDMAYRGRRIRDLYRWYEEIIVGLKKFRTDYGDALESLACDCMGEDFVLLDRSGDILMLPPSYRSTVVDPEVMRVETERMGNRELFMRCGNQSVNNDTLRQLIALSIYSPQTLEAADGMLFLGDLFHYLFCGKRAVGYSLANYGKLFNQHKQNWDDDIFDAFHLPASLKMPIAHFGDKLGSVDQMLCDEIGLSSRPIVISPGIHDSCCAAFCIPDSDPKWAFISSGSWSVVGMQTDCAIINEDGWRFNCSNSGMPMDSNMFKKLVAGMWVIQRCQKEWQSYSYSEIVELARAAKNDFHYIDPDAAQFYAPESMCKAISEDIFRRYGDEIAPNDAPRIARICFESLALKYRYTLDKLQMICARSIDKICILGGGSRNTLLNELSACACQLPVYTGVYEASVTGNLLVQLISCGEIENEEAAKDILRHSFTFQRFLPQDGPLWQQKYADFLRVLQEPVVN